MNCASGSAAWRRAFAPNRRNPIDDGRSGNTADPSASVPDHSGRSGGADRTGPAHRGAEERVDQRTRVRGALSRLPGDARRADPGGAGAGRGDPVDRDAGRRPAEGPDLLLCRHRPGPLQAPGGARRSASARGRLCARAARHRFFQGQGAGTGPGGLRGRSDVRLSLAAEGGRIGLMAQIHASAIVDSRAQVAEAVRIGPYSVVGPEVAIEAGTTIDSHVLISGRTRIGRDNRIFSFCSLGEIPQDKKYAGEPTELQIGNGNTIREYTSLNAGTVQGGGVTRVGSDNWIMSYVHIAHDCAIGDHTVLANLVQLAGHVHIGDWAVLGGMVGVHQFVRIGAHSMCGGGSTLV